MVGAGNLRICYLRSWRTVELEEWHTFDFLHFLPPANGITSLPSLQNCQCTTWVFRAYFQATSSMQEPHASSSSLSQGLLWLLRLFRREAIFHEHFFSNCSGLSLTGHSQTHCANNECHLNPIDAALRPLFASYKKQNIMRANQNPGIWIG